MNNMLQFRILERIENNQFGVFMLTDFLDLASYEAIKKSLQRLEQSGKIRRLSRGIYDKPKFNPKFQMFEAPNIDNIAKAIAYRYNWRICPSGNLALNLLGLSTQIPAKYIYISDGPYKIYNIMGTDIVFKHVAHREISGYSNITHLVLQSLKIIGKNNIVPKDIYHLKKFLNPEEKRIVLQESQRVSVWMYEIIKEICEVNNV